MNAMHAPRAGLAGWRLRFEGYTLVELMIAMALGLVVTLAVLALFLNVSRTNTEMGKFARQLENGRLAVQLIENDLLHAGFWAGYVPTFDSLVFDDDPGDGPTAIPDPCAEYATWTVATRNDIIAVPVSIHDAPPGTCEDADVVEGHVANTDILVVRYAENCAQGEPNCEAGAVGTVYFQPSFCSETAQSASNNTITLAVTASSTNDAYVGNTIRIRSGTGAGQVRAITAYSGASKVATLASAWTVVPDNSSVYTFGSDDRVLDTATFGLTGRDCATAVPLRRLISNIYYIRDHSESAGDGIPTLVRARLTSVGGVPGYVVEPLIEGIEGLRFEIGVDDISKTGEAVDIASAIDWVDPDERTEAKNRGDGVADRFCRVADLDPASDVDGCEAAEGALANAVQVNMFVLARTVETTVGSTDSKTYCLATREAGGACPADYAFTPSGTQTRFARRVYATAVRLHNVSGRRDTP